jgi:hypothetical protein
LDSQPLTTVSVRINFASFLHELFVFQLDSQPLMKLSVRINLDSFPMFTSFFLHV